MKKGALLLLSLVFILGTSIVAQEVTDKIPLGHTLRIESKILGEDRDVYIYLPRGYEGSDQSYPTLYLLDGRAHFHHGTGIVQFLSSNGLIPQMIVIGIPNTARNRDFSPTIEEGRTAGGGADKFIEFLDKELIPMINQDYRTLDYRILFGHSLTGLFSIYTLVTKPDLFDSYLAASPYLQYDKEVVVKKAKNKITKQSVRGKNLFITIGKEPLYFKSLKNLTKVLKKINTSDFEWNYIKMTKENHASIPHKTLYNGLESIFSGWKIPKEKTGDLSSILQHYQSLNDKFGIEVKPSEFLLNRLGYQLMGNNKLEEAIAALKANVESHPNSNNVYDSLGEAYEKAGRLKAAEANYKIAVEKGDLAKSPNLDIYKVNLERVQLAISEK